MSPDELRAYAETLILEHAREVEYLTIHEMAEDHAPGGTISEDDARAVDGLIRRASVTISWPDGTGSL